MALLEMLADLGGACNLDQTVPHARSIPNAHFARLVKFFMVEHRRPMVMGLRLTDAGWRAVERERGKRVAEQRAIRLPLE